MLLGTGAAALARRFRNGHVWLITALALTGFGLFWFEMLLAQIAFLF
jgi:hypothetical protein